MEKWYVIAFFVIVFYVIGSKNDREYKELLHHCNEVKYVHKDYDWFQSSNCGDWNDY